MRGNKIFKNGKPLPEIRPDRGFDNFPGWFGHQSSHAGKLTYLNGTASGPGISHHVNRIEAFNPRLFTVGAGPFFCCNPTQHLLGNLLGSLRPDVNYLVIPLPVGDQTIHVLLLDSQTVAVGLIYNLFLVPRNDHVLNCYGNTGYRSVFKPYIIQAISQKNRSLDSTFAVTVIDQICQLLFVHYLVYGIKGDCFRHNFVKDNPAYGSFLKLPIYSDRYFRLQVDGAGIKRGANLGGIGE